MNPHILSQKAPLLIGDFYCNPPVKDCSLVNEIYKNLLILIHFIFLKDMYLTLIVTNISISNQDFNAL